MFVKPFEAGYRLFIELLVAQFAHRLAQVLKCLFHVLRARADEVVVAVGQCKLVETGANSRLVWRGHGWGI